jgi:hypothetical protein
MPSTQFLKLGAWILLTTMEQLLEGKKYMIFKLKEAIERE